MIKVYLSALCLLMGFAYWQIVGIVPSSDSGIEADWISLGLVSMFFLLLFTIYKHSRNQKNEISESRQRAEVNSEMSERR